MTTMDQAMASAIQASRHIKAAHVRHHREHPDIAGKVLSYRGNELVAVVSTVQVERDITLAAADMSAYGFAADLLVLVMETYHAAVSINPDTGQEWGPGEMSISAEQNRGRERGLITDALMVNAYNRAGDYASRLLPYRVDKREALWLAEPFGVSSLDPNTKMGGHVHDTILRIMSQPTIEAELTERLGPMPVDRLSREQMLAHADCMSAKLLADPPLMYGRDWPAKPFIVGLAAEPGTERWAVIAEVTGQDPMNMGRGWRN